MTQPYRHRLARAFRPLSRQYPELTLGQVFLLCRHQMLDEQITALLIEAGQLSARYHLAVLRHGSRTTAHSAARQRTQQRVATLFTRIETLTARRDRLTLAVDELGRLPPRKPVVPAAQPGSPSPSP